MLAALTVGYRLASALGSLGLAAFMGGAIGFAAALGFLKLG